MNVRRFGRPGLIRAWRWAVGALQARRRNGAHVCWIDLRSTRIGEEGVYRRAWDEIADDAPKMGTSLGESPHIRLLELYARQGEGLFAPGNLERTEYFRLAGEWAEMDGVHRPELKAEAIRAQARAFVTLYDRLRRGDRREVQHFRESQGHSRPGALPTVQQTLTPGIYQIVDGHHRLAIAWVLGQQRARVTVLPPMPTELQRLVLDVDGNNGQRKLRQPIDRPEFDRSWRVEQPCGDYLAWMLDFLDGRMSLEQTPSMLDLGCSYGWLVERFSAYGFHALGVEPDPAALKIGRIAYGLRTAQLVQSTPADFVFGCKRTFDVVVVSGGLRALAEHSGAWGLEQFLKAVDSVTRRCLFLDLTQLDSHWWRHACPEWTRDTVARFMKERTSFTEVTLLGTETKPSGAKAGALIACYRFDARHRQELS